MKRPTPQDSAGFALYMRRQRARQERDERQLHGPGRNAEATVRHAYTRVTRTNSGLSEPFDLGDPDLGWITQTESHQGVEPIALESGRQLVVGESGIYHIDFDANAVVDAPADPDEVARLVARLEVAGVGLVAADTDTVDTVGGGVTPSCSVSVMWPIRAGQAITASFDLDLLMGEAPAFLFDGSLDVAWYAPLDVDAVGSS